MSYLYINKTRAAELARVVTEIEPGSAQLAHDINALIERADELGVSGLSHLHRSSIAGFLGAPLLSPSSPPAALAFQGPSLGEEIHRRLAHLEAYEELRRLGYPVSRHTRFDDADPPTLEDIEELADLLRQGIPGMQPEFITDERFSAAEIDAAVALLTDEELEELGLQIAMIIWPEDRQAVLNFLWGNVGATQMERLNQQHYGFEPQLKHENRSWVLADVDLDSPFDFSQANQRGLGNCWFMASLGATAVNNADFLQRNITQNPNGSYTVTLYDGGQPVEVTVSPFLPDPPYGSHYDPATGAYTPNWASVYEKAAAQYIGQGHYQGIESGFGGSGLGWVTGGDTNLDVNKPGLEEISERLEDGQPMVASTGPGGFPVLGPGRDDIIPMHVYVIVGVETRDGVQVVHVRNPWGHTGNGKKTGPVDLYLTEAEYRSAFISVNDAEAP